jgi:hypothetical protein
LRPRGNYHRDPTLAAICMGMSVGFDHGFQKKNEFLLKQSHAFELCRVRQNARMVLEGVIASIRPLPSPSSQCACAREANEASLRGIDFGRTGRTNGEHDGRIKFSDATEGIVQN